jgi:hypothetical protein
MQRILCLTTAAWLLVFTLVVAAEKTETEGAGEAAVKAEALAKYEAELKKNKARGEEIAAFLAQLSDDNMEKRMEAERALRKVGKDAIPALKAAKPEKEDALMRVRALLSDLSVEHSGVNEESAGVLMALGREEALAKRWGNAKQCYRRAEKIYDRLKEDADDKKNREEKKRFSDLQTTADRRADRAGHLEKGRGFSGLNLGFVRVGVQHDVDNQEDW